VVDDSSLHADYVSMAPGVKTPRQFHPDTRAWWIVQDGQIRFSIEGQEPFVASKGYLVQVPYRNVFSMETVGDKASLRLEVNIAGAKTMYPIDEQPAAAPGFKPDTDWGHFHLESSEFWFILLGKMKYKIGSLPISIADQGDIVYTPRETWHRARFGGTELACRLAMSLYQDLLHNYQPPD
jgi:mannose-6-phosphate isomerase-like protein (cupin superfamily)